VVQAARAVRLIVSNSIAGSPTDLDIVDKISWTRQADGSITTHGGDVHRFHEWTPAEEDLAPTQYRYTVP